jgi:hypothetical protein
MVNKCLADRWIHSENITRVIDANLSLFKDVYIGRAIAQAVSRRLPTVAALVQTRV